MTTGQVEAFDAAQRLLNAVRRMRMEGKRSAPRELKSWIDNVLAEEEKRVTVELNRMMELAGVKGYDA
jgi:hypothetical protein